MISEETKASLEILEEANVITAADKNLRNKIQSITRSLENLQAKKLRIDFEIKRQKKSLTRKREELKRVTKRNQAKLSLTLEQEAISETAIASRSQLLQRYDQILLQESSKQLETGAL